MDYGHWNVIEEMPEKAHGFIYGIENLITGQSYIGKKNLVSNITKAVPGRIRRVKTPKESNWKTYVSSSAHVKKDIEKYGKCNFAFTIIEWCMSRGELSYMEAKYQWDYEVLHYDTLEDGVTRKWYNCTIPAIKFIKPRRKNEA